MAIKSQFTFGGTGGVGSITFTDGQDSFESNIVTIVGDDGVGVGINDTEKKITISSTRSGSVFITDIQPQNSSDNVGNKVRGSANTILESCVTNTSLLTIYVLAITGSTSYMPVITTSTEQTVPVSLSSDKPEWIGSINVDIGSDTEITVYHEDGASDTVSINFDSGPTVLSAEITGGYPGSQTELKENDSFDLVVTTDTPITSIYIYDFGASKYQEFNFTATTTKQITLTAANRGNTAQSLAVKLKCMNENSIYGADYVTNSVGSVDGTNVMVLNNTYPLINVTNIVYPSGQQALKGGEGVTVNHIINNFDTVLYEDLLGELLIDSPTVYSTAKNITRNTGDYNISSNNLKITATRNNNNAVSYVQECIKIAHVMPNITVSRPDALRSGGNDGTSVQSHTITITSNQKLIEPPILNITYGTWSGSTFSGDGFIYTRNLLVADTDEKGVHTWDSIYAKNLAGQITTAITGDNTYKFAGFVSRDIYFSPFNNLEIMGVMVTDTSKLQARDKDLIAMTYSSNQDDVERTYTIIDNNKLRWNDVTAVNNNTTGLAFIRIEEVE